MPIVIAEANTNISEQGAHFNGTTAELTRVNDGIITSSASPGFLSFWIKLGVKDSTPTGDGFIICANSGNTPNVRVMYFGVGWGVPGPAWGYAYNRHTVYYAYQGSGTYIRNFSITTDQDTDLRTSMHHLVMNKSAPPGSLTMYLDGVLLGTSSTGYVDGAGAGITTLNPTQVSVGTSGYGSRSEGTVKNLVFSSTAADATIASNLYNIGINGDASTVGGFTMTAWYPLKVDFDDYSGNGKHFTTTTDVTLI